MTMQPHLYWNGMLRRTVFGGCDPTRVLGPALSAAGFDADAIRAVELPLPALARAGAMGVAVTRE